MTAQGYNNVSENKPKKGKIAIIAISSLILVAMVVAVAIGTGNKKTSDGETSAGDISASMKAIKAICQPTDYKDTCVNQLSTVAGNTTDPKELVKAGFLAAMNQVQEAAKNSTVLKDLATDPMTSQALQNCHDLMDYSFDDLSDSFNEIGNLTVTNVDKAIENLKVWLSGAITYQETCLDGFENTTGDSGEKMKKFLKTSRELTRNGLAMVTDISSILTSFSGGRRLMSEGTDEFPSWVDDSKRRLLQATPETVKPNVVVAQDGSGDYKTVTAALAAVPALNRANITFVIQIKEGIYNEQVTIEKRMNHLMFIGDGPTKTRITGNLNFMDGTKTFNTATVSVIGSNFIAKGVGFENSAGAIKHQAVALRVQSDMSIFYNCHMDGYQDTLYAHVHRQFYRDCTISGTIDFIFGDAASFFQNCRMVVRKPMVNQQCIVTAQGRTDARAVTGIVLQNCMVTNDPGLTKGTTSVYLGRPWKEFSRTVIMQSEIDDLIHSDGWMPWGGDFGLSTCFYTEFGNRGPGSDTTNRVKWPGIKTLTENELIPFTVSNFIGEEWIKPTGVPYVGGMMSAPAPVPAA